jgi:hypothetical protein
MASTQAVLRGVLACAAFVAAGAAHADAATIPTDQAELTQEVNLRCIYDMGEFGDDAVQLCMRADLAAAEALMKYPPQVQPLVDRCLQAMWRRGYAMVQLCVEADIKAAAALAAYGPEHAATLQACRDKFGKQGPARVSKCVEAALAAPN